MRVVSVFCLGREGKPYDPPFGNSSARGPPPAPESLSCPPVDGPGVGSTRSVRTSKKNPRSAGFNATRPQKALIRPRRLMVFKGKQKGSAASPIMSFPFEQPDTVDKKQANKKTSSKNTPHPFQFCQPSQSPTPRFSWSSPCPVSPSLQAKVQGGRAAVVAFQVAGSQTVQGQHVPQGVVHWDPDIRVVFLQCCSGGSSFGFS